MKTLFIDFETFSRVDLPKVGSEKYAYHESTEIICLAYGFSKEAIKLWTPDAPLPSIIRRHVDSGLPVRAWNIEFDFNIWNGVGKRFGFPEMKIDQIFCTMSDALALGLPASLEKCGEALKLDILKDKRGKQLITLLSKPRKPTKNKNYDRITKEIAPELFQEMYSYCVRDVQSEIEIFENLPWKLTDSELNLFRLTVLINQRGLPIDLELATAVIQAKNEYIKRKDEYVLLITNGELENTNSRLQSLRWIQKFEPWFENYQKAYLRNNFEKIKNENVKEFIKIRLELGRTPIKKFDFIINAETKGRIKGNLFFHKASTGRWAGKGFQMQNLPRDSHDEPEKLIEKFKSGDIENLSVINEAIKLIRSTITAPKNKKLIVSDFSGIENRVLAWFVGDKIAMQNFENNVDQYKIEASKIYNVDYDEVTKEQRTLGKIAVLSCNYMGGAKVFKSQCDVFGVKDMTEEKAKEIVTSYRDNNPKIKNLWRGIEKAAIEAIENNCVSSCFKIKFAKVKNFLRMKLPSGRMINYYNPKIKMIQTPWGTMRKCLTHFGVNSLTNKFEERIATQGILTENAIQAIARDFLSEAMIRIENAGYSIIGTVHDEIVSEVDKDFGSVSHFSQLMKNKPLWALDCPIDVETYESKRFKK